MAHGFAGAARFQERTLQLEIPARRTVRIVDEHHAILVLQAEILLLDHFGILPDEARAEHVKDERDDREPRKDIPRGDEIEPAEVARDGRDRGAAREPVAAGANLLEALIRQDEIDRGGGRLAGNQLEDFVGRAIG